MKNVISARDIEDLIAKGGDASAIPSDAILTPSARDLLRDLQSKQRNRSTATAATAPAASTPQSPAKQYNSKSPKPELETYFNSPYMHDLKQQICEIGRRLWAREYVDGNGGNISIRVGEDIALCTPTLVSKGFMKPEDMCLVDFEGNQLLGIKKRTSEILMHLQMMKRQPMAKSVVHCHPPYATAFAVAEILPPTCMIPEYEVFCSVAIAPYRTPGTPEMGKLVADLVDKHNTILMGNHGVVTWSHNSAEEAYWRMEIIEAYCRTMTVTTQLGVNPTGFAPKYMKDLLNIKKSLGFVDPRHELKECELCDNAEWRPGVQCAVPSKDEPAVSRDPEVEKLVQAITEQILKQMK